MNEPIPDFEGHPVDGTTLRIAGTVDGNDLSDVVVSIDDVVQLLSQYRVVGVDHKVDQKTGRVIRVQTLKVVEVLLVPLNPLDPDDDGVMRALPRPRSSDD